jgi:hypothetical protein
MNFLKLYNIKFRPLRYRFHVNRREKTHKAFTMLRRKLVGHRLVHSSSRNLAELQSRPKLGVRTHGFWVGKQWPALAPIATGIAVLLCSYLASCSLSRRHQTSLQSQSNRIFDAYAQTEPKQTFEAKSNVDLVLAVYLESIHSLQPDVQPLPRRRTTASSLTKVEFPIVSDCDSSTKHFPIDDFPHEDPFLPWIHDYFLNNDRSFVAQNRRRCETGEGKETIMRFREPQIALFQPISVREILQKNRTTKYVIADPENATWPETRFLCIFHDRAGQSSTTASKFPVNYEYVSWRKRRKPMYATEGRDVDQFEFSQLLFSCPVPSRFIEQNNFNVINPLFWIDLVPIRTPARRGPMLMTKDQVGPQEFQRLDRFSILEHYGNAHILPAIEDSGRIVNLPVCPTTPKPQHHPSFQLVACTWTSASYNRRGDTTTVEDSAARLAEWIVFHRTVGFDHIYIYDNTQVPHNSSESILFKIASQFPSFVTYHAWPAKSCSNNRPNHKNPGERSSQYAAEASCRERYGPTASWMAFIDTDEYLAPMGNKTWLPLLDKMDAKDIKVLKLKSSRGRPRESLMQLLDDPNECNSQSRLSSFSKNECLIPRKNETFLRVYNCDFIRPPRPVRFARAMKQIYKPNFVLSHFVHYSTITASMSRYYKDFKARDLYKRQLNEGDWGDIFLDELTEGTLIHAKSVLPHETMARQDSCQIASKQPCVIGRVCPNTTPFVDAIHQKNIFRDADGNFCNCW